jgi:hypothetical protein
MVTTYTKEKRIAILFLGLARNCENTLSAFFSYLERLEDHGFSCAAIIGENGSRDRTRTLIERARRVDLLDTGFMGGEANRLVRMARGRQALLEIAKKRGTAESHICVVDLDDAVLEPPEPRAVMAAIQRLAVNKKLFAVGATSQPVYYDLLSLRASGHDYSNLYADILTAKRRPLSYFQFHQSHIYKNQRLVQQLDPIPCASSFNGFCLYNGADYHLGTYRAKNEDHVCEHVSFNLSIARATGKQMLIDPGMVIRAPAEHIPVSFLRFWSDRVKDRVVESIFPSTLHKPQSAVRLSLRARAYMSKLHRRLLRSAPPGCSGVSPRDRGLLDEAIEDL